MENIYQCDVTIFPLKKIDSTKLFLYIIILKILLLIYAFYKVLYFTNKLMIDSSEYCITLYCYPLSPRNIVTVPPIIYTLNNMCTGL